MSLAANYVKCKLNVNPQVHYFDLLEDKHIALCRCRCGAKMSGFPDASTDTTRIVSYKKNTMINMNGVTTSRQRFK